MEASEIVLNLLLENTRYPHLLFFFNLQEHSFTRLLPVPADYSGGETHLIGYACMLNVGIGSVDIILIFSSHGMVCKLVFKFLGTDTEVAARYVMWF